MKLFVEYMEKEKVIVIIDEMVNEFEVAVKRRFSSKKNKTFIFIHYFLFINPL
jgi:hypothetical protein